jgi:hypothetical protein
MNGEYGPKVWIKIPGLQCTMNKKTLNSEFIFFNSQVIWFSPMGGTDGEHDPEL